MPNLNTSASESVSRQWTFRSCVNRIKKRLNLRDSREKTMKKKIGEHQMKKCFTAAIYLLHTTLSAFHVII